MGFLYSENVYLNLSTVVWGFDKINVRWDIRRAPFIYITIFPWRYRHHIDRIASTRRRKPCSFAGYAPTRRLLKRPRQHKKSRHRTGCAKPTRTKIVRSMNIKYRLDVVRCSIFELDWCRDSTSIQYFWTGEALGPILKILRKILRIIILLYILSLSSLLWRPIQLYLEGRGGAKKLRNTFQRLRPEEFTSGDFVSWWFRNGPKSCALSNSTKLGPGGEEAGGREEDRIWMKFKKNYSQIW